MEKLISHSKTTAASVLKNNQIKMNAPFYKLLILGFLGGAFIAFAAQGSSIAVHTIDSAGVSKLLSGVLFSTGLIMVVLTKAELFTGNSLLIISCNNRIESWKLLIRNWFIVYISNFIGAMFIVFCILQSGQLDASNGMLGGFTIKTAVYKTGLTFSKALFQGILCNWLVCLAIWMAIGAKNIAGKILSIFFPVWLFVSSGFEHSIANMYYIPAGILAKSNTVWFNAASLLGTSPEKINALNWNTFLFNNLIPVTLGNIIGGCIFVGLLYKLVFLRTSAKKKIQVKKTIESLSDTN